MGSGAISGNAGLDSIKFGSTEKTPYTQHNRLCSDIHYAVAGHESQWKGPHNSLDFPEMLSINYFCNPWLCFNYVSACFESSAHWGAVLFQNEEIEMNFPTRFTFFGISSEFRNRVVHNFRFPPRIIFKIKNKKHHLWNILRSMSAGPVYFHPEESGIPLTLRRLPFREEVFVLLSEKGDVRRKKKSLKQSEKSQRCISQTTATLSN